MSHLIPSPVRPPLKLTLKNLENWLRIFKVKNYTIHDDLSVSIYEDVSVKHYFLNTFGGDKAFFPFNLREIKGNFSVQQTNLASLEGLPREVEGNFICSQNRLTSLEHCPQIIRGNFNCSANSLTNLLGGPSVVEGIYSCASQNRGLTSLEGAPSKVKALDCARNKLTSLLYTPELEVGINCSYNLLKSLEYGPQNVDGSYDCSYNQLSSLAHSPKRITGHFNCSHNPEISRLIGFSPDFPATSSFIAENTNILELRVLLKKFKSDYLATGQHVNFRPPFIVLGEEINPLIHKQLLLSQLKKEEIPTILAPQTKKSYKI